MKFLWSILVGCLPLFSLYGETLYIDSVPRGDYALINVEESIALSDILTDPTVPIKEQHRVAQKIAASPGLYIPSTLLYAGLFFLERKDFEKAAPLCVAAIFRTEIDARISGDVTLGDSSTVIAMQIGEVAEEVLKSANELQTWQEAFSKAIDHFEQWDRATARLYDDRWVRLHSLFAFTETTFETISQNEKQKIIEKFYRELRGEEHEDDYANTSKEDEYYFDRQNCVFYHTDSHLSFYVPNTVKPQLDRFGKFTSLFHFPDRVELWLNSRHSSMPLSFEEDYQFALSRKEPNLTIEKMKIGNDIPCYRERHLQDNDDNSGYQIVNNFHIVNGFYSFDFELTCNLENETEFIQEIQKLLDSVKFN